MIAVDSIAFGVGVRFDGQPTAVCHEKHKGAQKVKWEGINQLGDVVRESSLAIHKEHRLIVELKACQSVREEHVAQRLGYLKSSRVKTGLLVNFGAAKLHVKEYLMTVTEH